MNQNWQNELRDDLARLDSSDQLRTLRTATPIHFDKADETANELIPTGKWIERHGKRLLNFASNDYLGLAHHPSLKAAAIKAIEAFGTGSGASRLVTGHLSLHAELEARFAQFKHAEAALLFSTGYMANLAVLTTLPRRGDLICIDKLSHASLIDAARASDATLRVFPHLHLEKLERLLQRFKESSSTSQPTKQSSRAFIVTDSIFSMDGDAANLPQLCELAEKYNAVLVVDEAHATGLFGDTGAGLAEHQRVANRIDITVSTASKALGGLGGIVTGSKAVIDTLINRAHSLIYTTAPPPAQVASIIAALDVIESEPQRRSHVLALATSLRDQLSLLTRPGALEALVTDLPTPIIPLITGTAESALHLAQTLENQGICAPAIRPPTVAPNSARVRLTVRADMDEDDLDRLIEAVGKWLNILE